MFQRKLEKCINVLPQGLDGLAVIAGFAVSIIYLLTVMTIEQGFTLADSDNHHIKIIGFFTGALILSIFCFIDDKKGIPASVKLLGQILAAVCAVAAGIRIDQIGRIRRIHS